MAAVIYGQNLPCDSLVSFSINEKQEKFGSLRAPIEMHVDDKSKINFELHGDSTTAVLTLRLAGKDALVAPNGKVKLTLDNGSSIDFKAKAGDPQPIAMMIFMDLGFDMAGFLPLSELAKLKASTISEVSVSTTKGNFKATLSDEIKSRIHQSVNCIFP
jgi:hypothetical protein